MSCRQERVSNGWNKYLLEPPTAPRDGTLSGEKVRPLAGEVAPRPECARNRRLAVRPQWERTDLERTINDLRSGRSYPVSSG